METTTPSENPDSEPGTVEETTNGKPVAEHAEPLEATAGPAQEETIERPVAVDEVRPSSPAPAIPEQMAQRQAQPAPSLIVAALSRSAWPIVFLALIGAAIGIGAGFARKPVYSATSTLQVGRVNPNSPGFYGFVQSASVLSATISRDIYATGVLNTIQRQTGIPPTEAASRLTATPVPGGANFSVIATSSSPQGAVALANAAASAIIKYEATSNFTTGGAASILAQYHTQAAALEAARAHVSQLRAIDHNVADPQLLAAEAQEDAAQAHATALAAAYTQAVEGGPVVTSLVAPLSNALIASSDRTHKIELYGIIGLAAGFLLGASAAILAEQRRTRPVTSDV